MDVELPYCFDLHTVPRPGIGKILVTGATGYVGGRLVQELITRGYDIRILERIEAPDHDTRWPGIEVVVGDVLDYESIAREMKDIRVAYYLIHSLSVGRKELASTEIKAAVNFRMAAEANKVGRIIYLGGLGESRAGLSLHLQSRLKVAEELSAGKVPVTVLRAAMIIGSGSASFEILENLAKNLRLVLIPKWAKTKCQPVGIRDVIKYLVGVIEADETTGKTYDIGGKTILSYLDMLRILAGLLGKRKLFVTVPVTNYKVYGYIASLFTPVPAQMVMILFEGARNEVVCRDEEIKKILDFDPLSFSEAVIFALDREDQDRIRTRWSDAYPPAHDLAIKMHELGPAEFVSSCSLLSEKKAATLFSSVCRIGGREGWYHNTWMWRIRGMMDKLAMGVGTARGRRSNSFLRINDVIGFWRVEDLQQDRRLLLRAEMKLPGKAWLEFRIDETGSGNKLTVTAYFHPKGFMGLLYWYFFIPFHSIIFKALIKDIEMKS